MSEGHFLLWVIFLRPTTLTPDYKSLESEILGMITVPFFVFRTMHWQTGREDALDDC